MPSSTLCQLRRWTGEDTKIEAWLEKIGVDEGRWWTDLVHRHQSKGRCIRLLDRQDTSDLELNPYIRRDKRGHQVSLLTNALALTFMEYFVHAMPTNPDLYPTKLPNRGHQGHAKPRRTKDQCARIRSACSRSTLGARESIGSTHSQTPSPFLLNRQAPSSP